MIQGDILEEPELTPDVVSEQPEGALIAYEEPPQPPHTAPVSGAAKLWLWLSTLSFSLLVTFPVYLVIAAAIFLITLMANGVLLFESVDAIKMAELGPALVISGGLIAGCFFFGGIAHVFNLSLEEPTGVSLRGFIISWLASVLGALTFLVWLIKFETTTGATLAVGVATANASTLLLGYSWYGGKRSIRKTIEEFRHLKEHPFAAGVWSTVSSTMSAAAAIGLLILWTLIPATMPAEHEQPEWLNQAMHASSTPSLSSLSSHTLGASSVRGNQSDFNSCLSRLMSEPTPQHSYQSAAITRVRTQTRLNDYDADDVIQKVMINVCLKHAREPTTDLPMYFNKSVRYSIIDARRNWSRQCDLGQPLIDDSISHDPRAQMRALLTTKWLICQLKPAEQELVDLYLQGYGDREIGEHLGQRKNTITRRRLRIFSALKSKYDALH